jgi:fibronectin type 3 domain-containing protein
MSWRTSNFLSAVVGGLVATVVSASLASATFNSTGAGGPMPVVTATLAAPTGLSASATCQVGLPTTVKVNLSWTATTSTFADGYEVKRSTSGGPFVSIGTVSGGTTTTYSDTTVTYSTSYSYVVTATKNNWRSSNSNTANATTKSSLCL